MYQQIAGRDVPFKLFQRGLDEHCQGHGESSASQSEPGSRQIKGANKLLEVGDGEVSGSSNHVQETRVSSNRGAGQEAFLSPRQSASPASCVSSPGKCVSAPDRRRTRHEQLKGKAVPTSFLCHDFSIPAGVLADSAALQGYLRLCEPSGSPYGLRWSSRWAQVHNNFLYLYKRCESQSPCAVFLLDMAQLVCDPSTYGPYSFLLVTRAKQTV